MNFGKIILKSKYQGKANLFYMDKDSFIVKIKIEDVYKDIASDVEKRFDTSNYGAERPLSKGKNKKVTGLMKDKLWWKDRERICRTQTKMYSYLIDDGIGNKKAKEIRKCITKQRLKSEDYKKCFENNQIILKSQQKFKSEAHNIFTEEVNL